MHNIAGVRSPSGASAASLLAALDQRLTLCANVALMLEYEAVCSRSAHRTAAGLTQKDVGIFLDAIAALVKPVETHYLWRPQLRDPGDEMVLLRFSIFKTPFALSLSKGSRALRQAPFDRLRANGH